LKRTVLALVLIIGLLVIPSATALAVTFVYPAFSDIANHPARAELTLMASLGVYLGTSGITGPATPNDPLTRAEAVTWIIRATGRAQVAQNLVGTQPLFFDWASIPVWSWGFVNAAALLGIVNSPSFSPSSLLTYAEAVTILVRAVPGHRAQVPGPPISSWPQNYIQYATAKGFNGPVTVGTSNQNLPITRGDLARMTFAMQQIGPLTEAGRETCCGAVLPHDETIFEGVLTAFSPTTMDVDDICMGYHTLTLANTVFMADTATLTPLVNGIVRVVCDTSGNVVFVQKIGP